MGSNGVEGYSVDELRFYVTELELHSIMWFSSVTQPHLDAFVQTMLPIIHNYPLVLALGGHVVEESYISKYNVYKNTRSPAWLFYEKRIYAYPMLLEKMYYKKVLLSMAETDYVFYKPQTRFAVPIMTHYNTLAPGTRGRTIIVTTRDEQLPKNDLYLRVGAKRYGIWKATRVIEVQPKFINGSVRIVLPFNVADVSREDLVGSLVVVLKHYAGDIAFTGAVRRALELQVEGEKLQIPLPFFVSF